MNKSSTSGWTVENIDVITQGTSMYGVAAKVSSTQGQHDLVCHFTPCRDFCIINLEMDGKNENPLRICLWEPERWRVAVGSYTIRNGDGTLKTSKSGAVCTSLPVTDEGELAIAERCFRNAVKFFKEIVPELQKALPQVKPLSDTIKQFKDIIG